MTLSHTGRFFLQFVAFLLVDHYFLFLDHFLIELLLSFAQFVLELLTLIFVGVLNRVEIDVLASLKAFNLASEDFLDTWQTEEEE